LFNISKYPLSRLEMASKHKSPFIIAALSCCVLLSSINITSYASAFTDISAQNKYNQAIIELTEEGVINGYNDGTFRPEKEINRAEFLKIIIASTTPEPEGQNCFTDVTTQWFARYICYAKDQKITDGYSNGSFEPTSNINLAEALKISLGGNLEAGIGEAWYIPYLEIAEEKNYFYNMNQDLGHRISRGEAAQLIYNILNPPEVVSPIQNTPATQTNGFDFPIAGLFDDEYTDLPPGDWDWNDNNNDGANYRNFTTNIGTFKALKDSDGNHYGWELIGNNPDAIDYGGAAAYFGGSPGTDILNLGANGSMNSFGNGNLGDGPDVLVFEKSHSLDFRTGSSLSGSTNDDDLVIAGCNPNTGTDFDIRTTTIHTGPGSDLVFVRDMERAAIDAGNGEGGTTSVIDPNDGDDTVVFRGNMLDFRFFGGNGDDTVVWYIDEVNQSTTWLGPNFFGGGGSGDALWDEGGEDKIVLVIPVDTAITDTTPTQPGELLVRIAPNYEPEIWWDDPVYNDLYARYCITCGIGPNDEKTVIFEYNSIDGKVRTGYFYINNFELLQVGIGSSAKVFAIDDVNGTIEEDKNATTYTPPEIPEGYCDQ